MKKMVEAMKGLRMNYPAVSFRVSKLKNFGRIFVIPAPPLAG
jgi:hypothetical protein